MSSHQSAADIARQLTDWERARRRLEQAVPGPSVLTFPDGWTESGSWHRAQTATAHVGPSGPAQWRVLLERPDGGMGSQHRVDLAVLGGQVVVECDCESWRHRQWCAHVAHLWWRWVRRDLVVVDLDSGKSMEQPPWWPCVRDRHVGGESDE